MEKTVENNEFHIEKYFKPLVIGKKRIDKKQAELYFNRGKKVRFIAEKGAHRDFSVSTFHAYSFDQVLKAFLSANVSEYANFYIKN